MEKFGKIDIDELERLKTELFEKASDPLINDAYKMIESLEKTLITVVTNHIGYVEWACKQIHPDVENPFKDLLSQSQD